MNLSDTDQAPYTAPAPQTATVSDEAVQAFIDRMHDNTDNSYFGHVRRALTAALPHLALSASPCSAEVKEALEYCERMFRIDLSKQIEWNGDEFNQAIFDTHERVKLALRILSQIVTKPVDVAAVRRQAFEEFAKAITSNDNFGFDDGISADWHPYPEHQIRKNIKDTIRALSPAEPVDQCDFDKADWFYRDIDTDDSGDSAHEAIVNHPEYSIHLIHSSYRGDSRYAFRAPTLNLDDDDDEVLHFPTEAEALSEAHKRKAEIEALNAATTSKGGE